MDRAGHETTILEENLNRRLGQRQYWREELYDEFPEPLVLRFLLDDTGRITGLGLGPLSRTPAPESTARPEEGGTTAGV